MLCRNAHCGLPQKPVPHMAEPQSKCSKVRLRVLATSAQPHQERPLTVDFPLGIRFSQKLMLLFQGTRSSQFFPSELWLRLSLSIYFQLISLGTSPSLTASATHFPGHLIFRVPCESCHHSLACSLLSPTQRQPFCTPLPPQLPK